MVLSYIGFQDSCSLGVSSYREIRDGQLPLIFCHTLYYDNYLFSILFWEHVDNAYSKASGGILDLPQDALFGHHLVEIVGSWSDHRCSGFPES